MSQISEQRERERKNEALKMELLRAIYVIVNPSQSTQDKLVEAISKILSNNK